MKVIHWTLYCKWKPEWSSGSRMGGNTRCLTLWPLGCLKAAALCGLARKHGSTNSESGRRRTSKIWSAASNRCIDLHLCKAGSIPKSGRCLEEETATCLSVLAWRIPWAEEPGRLQFMGSQSQTRLGWLSKAEVGDDLYYTSARCSPWKNWGKNTGGICVLFLQPCGNLQGSQINS